MEFELNWLSDLKSSDPQIYDLLESFLFHKTENFEIAAFDLCGIDVGSFSTLVEERYIDSFIMNFPIKKYLSSMIDDRKKCFIYLETDLFKNSLKNDQPTGDNFVRDALSKNPDAKIVFMALHMNDNHWGIIIVNTERMVIHYDDRFH